jgi:hypothetical protein
VLYFSGWKKTHLFVSLYRCNGKRVFWNFWIQYFRKRHDTISFR